MTTYLPKIAVETAKTQALDSIDASLIPLQTAKAAINIILNKRELRESLSDDEVIDLGLVSRRLESIENMMNVSKEMILGYQIKV